MKGLSTQHHFPLRSLLHPTVLSPFQLNRFSRSTQETAGPDKLRFHYHQGHSDTMPHLHNDRLLLTGILSELSDVKSPLSQLVLAVIWQNDTILTCVLASE